jgi:HK97 family phage major capsid protein
VKHFNPLKLETKSAQEDDPVKLVEDLTKQFGNFRTKQDERLAEIEKKSVDSKLTARLDQLEAKLNRPGAGGTETEADVELERKALNRFLREGPAALDEIEKKALNWGTPSAGGYVVAPEYSARVIEKITEFSPIRSLTTPISIGSSKIYFPVTASKVSGGWVTETGPRPESQPVFDQVEIEAFEQAVIVPVSAQLLEDSMIDLAGYIERQIAEQFGKMEATAFVNGDGNGKPTGILHDTSDYVTIVAQQDGSDLIEKLVELFYAIPSYYAARGTWLLNRRTMAFIRAHADTADGMLWSDSLANGQPATLLGRPIAEAVDFPDFAPGGSPSSESFAAAFGDIDTGYKIVDRIGLQILRDDFTGADNGLVKIRARRRVGGKPVQPEAIAVLKTTYA